MVACKGQIPRESVLQKPNPVLLIGIDGATWDLIDPMIEQGELPTFNRLKRSGAHGQLLSLSPLSSPVVWTTIATGRFPRVHNILDHTYPYVEGAKNKITSAPRRVPALWNIATESGQSVGVINWFASHPPEIVKGSMISDRAAEGVEGASYPLDTSELVKAVVGEFASKEARRAVMARFLPWEFSRGLPR
jgi:predicted AlkP superfamily phosphohydrolase/phosphomutase